MKLTKNHTFGIVFLSIIISGLIINIGIAKGSLFSDLFAFFMPIIIGAISIILFFLLNWAMPNSKLGIAIFLALVNILVALLIRMGV